MVFGESLRWFLIAKGKFRKCKYCRLWSGEPDKYGNRYCRRWGLYTPPEYGGCTRPSPKLPYVVPYTIFSFIVRVMTEINGAVLFVRRGGLRREAEVMSMIWRYAWKSRSPNIFSAVKTWITLYHKCRKCECVDLCYR